MIYPTPHQGETFRKIPNESSKWRERWLYDKCRRETLDDSLWREKKVFIVCSMSWIHLSKPSEKHRVPESRNDGSWWVWLQKYCSWGIKCEWKCSPFFGEKIGLSCGIVKSILEIFLIWYFPELFKSIKYFQINDVNSLNSHCNHRKTVRIQERKNSWQ